MGSRQQTLHPHISVCSSVQHENFPFIRQRSQGVSVVGSQVCREKIYANK